MSPGRRGAGSARRQAMTPRSWNGALRRPAASSTTRATSAATAETAVARGRSAAAARPSARDRGRLAAGVRKADRRDSRGSRATWRSPRTLRTTRSSPPCSSGRPRAFPQPRRVADGHRQAPRHRSPPPSTRAPLAHTRCSRALLEAESRGPGVRAPRHHGRRHRRRRAAADLHGVPSGDVDRRARRADAAVGRRPHDRRDRPGLPRTGSDDRAAHRPREEDDCKGRCALRGAARRRAARAAAVVGARGRVPRVQRRLLGLGR